MVSVLFRCRYGSIDNMFSKQLHLFRTPPCICPVGWAGDHCELRDDPRTNTTAGSRTKARSWLFVALFVVLVPIMSYVFYKHVAGRFSRKKYRFISSRPPFEMNKKWPSQHLNPSTADINLSPHRDFGQDTEDEDYIAPFQPAKPLIALPNTPPRETVPFDHPILYMGPPRDEDGNELDEISIL